MPATSLLPPTPRDFEIHRLHLVEHVSTRALAERYKLCQTRIRQIARRVCDWLVQTLPVKTQHELAQEARLAQHLAADQLQHQVEHLQIFWNQTSDPKYLRQQTRIILALARLGTVPGVIDSIAADVLAADVLNNAAASNSSPHSATSNSITPASDLDPASGDLDSDLWNREPADLNSPPPPSGDCSTSSTSSAIHAPFGSSSALATPEEPSTSTDDTASLELDLEGLNLIERRLLTLLDQVPQYEADRRAGLEQTLSVVRRQQSAIELQLSPNIQGVSLQSQTVPASSPPASASESLEYEPAAITPWGQQQPGE